MKLHLWGTDFRRSSAEMRKRLYVPAENRRERMAELLALGFQDLIYLPTCNRVEFYTTVPDYFTDSRRPFVALLKNFGLGEEDFYRGYHLEGKSAIRHLTRVACSLESLVVGESQILGQLKDALLWNRESDLPVEPSTERCFQLVFETAKKVRTQTAIGERPVSVATLGLQHLTAAEARLPLTAAVVVGRGPISLLIVEWLKKNRPACPITWVNRSVEVLGNFSESNGVTLQRLSDFLAKPGEFSHLFTATASTEAIFTQSFFDRLTPRPRMVFDFAQPPDVAPSESPDLEIVHLEGLREEARLNRLEREKAVGEAEALIENALREYLLERKETPLLRDFGTIEPEFLVELTQTQALIEREYPLEFHPRLKKLAEKLVKKNLHLSREHLRRILREAAHSDSPAII